MSPFQQKHYFDEAKIDYIMTWTLFILSWLVFRANVLADDDKRTITRKDIDVQSSFSRSSRPQGKHKFVLT